ncbi:MBL fold metallo-hydrolase [Roseobacter cerasinus]|uniref:MBL fold metallo-hydrolase n=1 Tax=Roseobacter cerasinus TaxID=2602289 RepID=A0A640VQZ2_9RHOB|nr:N-acyl homoserine lactonase family protein [Roseobacter cerasinus]GFE49511.1 MBL fold metallo-hydrolase [Roseobacter cerasinus]
MPALLNGHPRRLAVLDYGLFQVHETSRIIGICGYLIQTDAGENILIDTGFPAKYASNAAAASAEDGLDPFGRVLSLSPKNLAPAQLALLGLTAADITLMIQSHTHIDHVGFLHGFPDATLLIAAAERALLRPIYWPGKEAMTWPDQDEILIEGDTELGPGFDVYLVPGHTPGQLAFCVTLPDTGAVVLTSDAISRPEEIDEGCAGAWDVEAAKASAHRLMQIAQDRQAMVIYGHCPKQWPELRKAPDFYG